MEYFNERNGKKHLIIIGVVMSVIIIFLFEIIYKSHDIPSY